ncbi:GH14406 [Drosophila grimshawi]|uniref:GH14406 n=2 Tax=Drosophila grimshawi TaxID=7222 RepID=B4J1A0_DROGR|nr:GH14406 [Drosophila grimshawi]
MCLACRVSEFSCKGSGNSGNICVPLDKYCDGRSDCADGSDEPKHCSVCNRTYYGDIGRTYAIKVPTPQWNKLPFLCHLTFTASGHDQGDIVQIIFDGFTVGRFDEGMVDTDVDGYETNLSPTGELPGCPEGFMQLSELGRPFTGGSWCGKATGPQLYFSETSTVTASVKVFHPPRNLRDEKPFEFSIRYKFISQSDAVVRYGLPEKPLELGRVTPGTYCTRQFDECYRNKCRLQSPNYPGMYPRNVTCYWTIRQKEVPTSKHAMIAVSQENQHKALVKRSIASFNKTSRSIRAWSDCTGERDHLIFYDGSSTNDPVLAKYCGGDWLPRVVSRGPEMLVAFHSSPFSAPLQQGIPNRGFELDVDILFTDSDSYDFAQGMKNLCEFHINASNPDDVLFSRRGRMGRIVSPRHTLPPNTTCTYHFHGYPGDLIWLSFTSYNLQILQQAIHDNNTLGRSDLPPWITRLRMWDSYGTYLPIKSTSVTTGQPPPPPPVASSADGGKPTLLNQSNYGSYYYSASNPKLNRNLRVNIDNAWNPVDTYIYGPTQSSIFNQENKYSGYQGSAAAAAAGGAAGKQLGGIKDSLNYISGSKSGREGGGGASAAAVLSSDKNSQSAVSLMSTKGKRRLMLEIYDYETPKLCDHTAIGSGVSGSSALMGGNKQRPCSPLESYVSTGRDLKLEFHTHTGTALFPAQFALNYEFVDTEQGGETWTGRRGEDPVPPLCSRVFRKRKGNIQVPRNVFLYGRGGAKNITCLYRFEAGTSERVKLVLHNVSFGEGTACTTDSDLHMGRPRCNQLDPEGRITELRLYDVPFRDVKIQLGCFCDNSSALYSNAPLTFVSHSRIMELSFTVTRLNISEDFADVFFSASYEFKRQADCRKQLKLKGAGGEDELKYPLKPQDASCEGLAWYIEAQSPERSLFVQTWGAYLPVDPTSEDAMRCHTKNRLMVYSGRPLKPMRVVCPAQSGPRPTSLHIFSEDWTNGQPLFMNKPINLVLEPILKEPGDIAFTWLEIHRTKNALLQQLDLHVNASVTTGMGTPSSGAAGAGAGTSGGGGVVGTGSAGVAGTGGIAPSAAANETLNEFGFYPKESDCEYKCPEIDACIAASLWCDGHHNCPSGFDESEEECGTARKLLELPGGVFAALGCIAAALTACLIFCMFGLMRKRKKSVVQKSGGFMNSANGNGTVPAACNIGTLKKDFKKEALYIDPAS